MSNMIQTKMIDIPMASKNIDNAFSIGFTVSHHVLCNNLISRIIMNLPHNLSISENN
jgi:hypothetical protein